MSHTQQIVIPQRELADILNVQQREIAWWRNQPVMHSQRDIDEQVRMGQAVVLPGGADHYRMSINIPAQLRVLRKDTLRILEDLSEQWHENMCTQDIVCHDLFLVVTSLARTTVYQRELIAQGYPAAEDSTHTKLGAFDIGYQWFIDNNRQDALDILIEILAEAHQQEQINWVIEPSIGAYHIAHNPTAGNR